MSIQFVPAGYSGVCASHGITRADNEPRNDWDLIPLLAAACIAADAPSILPTPQKMVVGTGTFQLVPDTHICADSVSRAAGEFLAAQLRQSTGYKLEVNDAAQPGAVYGGILGSSAKRVFIVKFPLWMTETAPNTLFWSNFSNIWVFHRSHEETGRYCSQFSCIGVYWYWHCRI